MSVPPLDHTTTGYGLPFAYWMARAAQLAYQDADEIRAETERWGFDRSEFLSSPNTGPLPLSDTQAFVARSDRMVLVAFRGTEVKQLKDWLSDAEAPGVPGPGGHGFVHVGFDMALGAVYPKLTETIARFRDSGQTLWITGHSLGGALAMLAGAKLHFEDPRLLPDGVYTFGQPRACDRLLADAYNADFTERHYRFVNNNDIVAQLPPEPLYHHVDAMRYIDSDGAVHETMPVVGGVADRAKGFASNPFAPGSDAVADHHMSNYVTLLERAAG